MIDFVGDLVITGYAMPLTFTVQYNGNMVD